MLPDASSVIDSLNRNHGDGAAHHFLTAALARAGRVAMVSSFGADSAVLLHMVAKINPELPVMFIDTLALFPETVVYQQDLAAYLGLRNVQTISPHREMLFLRDQDGLLHRANADACCQLRKAEPLARALSGYDAWVTGRKRHQAASRASLTRAELEPDTGRIRLNPLADWTAAQVGRYLDRHALPRHPLVARGYPSIGCAPCTSRVLSGEVPRAGRWRGSEKTECGIHFIGGVPQRTRQEDAA